MIVEGDAKVMLNQTEIARLGTGEVFGEMALLTGEPRSASVVAESEMCVYRLDRPHFDALLDKSPS